MKFGDWAWEPYAMAGAGFPALAELERVVGAEALASAPSPGNEDGGEWDTIYGYSRRTRRRLIGARYMRRGAMPPDVLAELICSRVPGCDNTSDAIAWYVSTCLVAIEERRLLAHRARHLRVARYNGHATYYAYRTALARERGYGSVWDMRRRKKWT